MSERELDPMKLGRREYFQWEMNFFLNCGGFPREFSREQFRDVIQRAYTGGWRDAEEEFKPNIQKAEPEPWPGNPPWEPSDE